MTTIAVRRAAAAAAFAFAAALAPWAQSSADAATANVVVRAPERGADFAAAAVVNAGGTVGFRLPIVDGVAAQVPANRVAALRAEGLDVTDDGPVTVAGSVSYNQSTIKPVTLQEVGADQFQAAGIDGDPNRTVALIDTGVTTAGIPDLAGRIVPVNTSATGTATADCLDLSGEGTCADNYGHGTFLAGLIAGNGAASNGAYKGVAPGTRIVSIKIAGRDGSSDVSKVLAAIQWVVSFKDTYGIRVLNLSLGTDSTQPYQIDPLNLAVERAWDAGVTTVVAAGNRGPKYGTVSKPGDDPMVITVGATEDRETPAVDDDHVPLFSGRGSTALAKPDVVAPGTRLVSILPTGSAIQSMLAAKGSPAVSGYYRRASGTSMSTAVVSGVAALLADAHPEWSPGQVKTALMTTAQKVGLTDPLAVGRGMVNVVGASAVKSPKDADAGIPRGTGEGALQASRGSLVVTALCDTMRQRVDKQCDQAITGDQTAQGSSFDEEQYAMSTWSGTSWYASQWAGTSWYGTSWYGTSWYGTSWYSYEADQGEAWDGNSDTNSVGGFNPPGSGIYGLWR